MKETLSDVKTIAVLEQRAIINWLRTKCMIKTEDINNDLLEWAIETIRVNPSGNVVEVLESLGRRVSKGKEKVFTSRFVPSLIEAIARAGETNDDNDPSYTSAHSEIIAKSSSISKKIRIAVLLLIGSTVAIGAGYYSKRSLESVDIVTDETLDNEIGNSWRKFEIINLGDSKYCDPCRKIEPIIERLAKEYIWRIRFISINTRENPGASERYDVKYIPKIVILKNGEQVDHFVGARGEEELKERIDGVLVE